MGYWEFGTRIMSALRRCGGNAPAGTVIRERTTLAAARRRSGRQRVT